jgi:hypothetical protein
MKKFGNSRIQRLMQVICLAGLLSACQSQSYWDKDPDFGSTVNNAIKAQVVNPNAPQAVNKNASGMDGVSAQKSIDNYQKSFDKNATEAYRGPLIRSNITGAGAGQ